MANMQVAPYVYSKEYYESECGGWENWHTTYGTKIEPRLSYPYKLAKIKKGMRVLDFGCGRGELTWRAAKQGAIAIGMDYSKDALELTKKLPKLKNGSLTFVHNTTLKLDLASESIDVILFIDVLEHLYPKQLEVLLKEFHRVLRKGGRVIVHTAPNRDYYDYGYPLFTRWASMLINPVYRLVFGEWLITRANPRRPYDALVHINESTMSEVKTYFTKGGFHNNNLWYSSEHGNIRIRDKVRLYLLQPQYGALKRWFCYDIWGICTK